MAVIDQLWRSLLTKETLGRAWHLARLDSKLDFAEDLYSTDVYGLALDENIRETINRLSKGGYQVRPLLRMEVPKGSLAFRPASVIPIQDRVVLCGIVLLMAPRIDRRLFEGVYSWRVKHPLPKHGPIFQDTDITDLPFLKKGTIRQRVDPFEPWYEQWPEFDEVSRKIFLKQGYDFLATSDISAYFENIQLPILRDQILRHFPLEHKLANLLMTFLEIWSTKTEDGRSYHRGIPQGNLISSFLGNLFLMPLDAELRAFVRERKAKYYRYMDDVRIFTKRREDARLALFTMDRALRKLHLNVQSAKTKIFDESQGEITELVIDARVDELTKIIDVIQKHKRKGGIAGRTRAQILTRLRGIGRADPASRTRQRIVGARRALEGLTLRAFNRWITAHSLIGSDDYIGRLLLEIERSADAKLTKKLVQAVRTFPRRRGIQNEVLRFLRSQKNIFAFQEAECMRALRYLSHLDQETIEFCSDRLKDKKRDTYVRMQAAYLLSRIDMPLGLLKSLETLFDEEPDPYVQAALATVLVQRREDNQRVVRKLAFHPNEKIKDLGKLFRASKYDVNTARARIAHMFRPNIPWIACDNICFVHLMASSTSVQVRRMLMEAIRNPRMTHAIVDLRPILRATYTRLRESLEPELPLGGG